jgi:hypothetical protein
VLAEDLKQAVMEKIGHAGWAASRALLRNPAEEPSPEEIDAIEQAMKALAREGLVSLWRLEYKHEPISFMAVAKPDMELDKELEERGAWAVAVRLDPS